MWAAWSMIRWMNRDQPTVNASILRFDASFILPPSALPLTAEDRKSLCEVYVASLLGTPLVDVKSGINATGALDKVR